MTQSTHRALSTQQFRPHVPDAVTSVVNVSGDPRARMTTRSGTVYPEHGPVGRPIPQRRARMIDGTEHDYDHDARGMDTMLMASRSSGSSMAAISGTAFSAFSRSSTSCMCMLTMSGPGSSSSSTGSPFRFEPDARRAGRITVGRHGRARREGSR